MTCTHHHSTVRDVETMNRYTEMGRCVSLYEVDDLKAEKLRPMKGKRAAPKAFVLANPFN